MKIELGGGGGGGGPRAPLHLTYCTNIHAGETWDEVLANLRTHVTAVKARVAPDAPFGVGLRLSNEAALALGAPGELARFRDELAARRLYVLTVNGFPYGAFHGTAVKERVYRPDWLEDERVAYSDRLAAILAALVSPHASDVEGSVSTVPGCFQARAREAGGGAAAEGIAARLRRHAAGLVRLRDDTGRTVTLALEPEPACILETTADAVGFFEEHLASRESVAAFGDLCGLSGGEAEAALRRHLGVCLDACHAAVEFEEPAAALRALAAAGVRLLKVQVSAGLRVPDASAPGARAALARFAEGVYLHQTVARGAGAGSLQRFADLPEALAAGTPPGLAAEWRVHFHVPIFRAALPPFESTQPFTAALLRLIARGAAGAPHLEVETYTWDVLPEEHRGEPVDAAVARELAWARGILDDEAKKERAP